MIVYRDVIQGSTLWRRLRAGIPTASQFDRILTKSGARSKQAEKYMLELLAEKITGSPEDSGQTFDMIRGTQMEAEAVKFYEFTNEAQTVPIGFVTNDDGTIGASPDRFVGERGRLEIKAPKAGTHMAYLLQAGAVYDDYKVQAQGQLWISEGDWSDVLSFHPELPPALHRTERDSKFIALLTEAVEEFSAGLEKMFLECIERGWVDSARAQREEAERISNLSSIDWMRELLIEAKESPAASEGSDGGHEQPVNKGSEREQAPPQAAGEQHNHGAEVGGKL